MRKLLKQPSFIIGFAFISILLIVSLLYPYLIEQHVKKIITLYTKSGNLIGRTPFTPFQVFPFGTDDYGFQMFFTILDGAKYTILFSLAIGLLRTLIGLILAVISIMTNIKLKSSPSTMFQAVQTIPIAIVLYIILQPVIFDTDHYVYYKSAVSYSVFMQGKGYEFSMWTTIVFETFLLTLVSLPVVTKLFSEEIRLIMTNEYILCSKTLGASKWQQIIRHVIPQLWSKTFIVFIQQIIQALLLIMHLGVLQIYFGGTYIKFYQMEIDIWGVTNEWSAIIGHQLENYGATPWLVLSPLFCFALLILSYNLIIQGVTKGIKSTKQKTGNEKLETEGKRRETPTIDDFQLIIRN